MKRIAVGDIMTRNVVSVSPRSTLHECAKKMARERINSVIVSEDKKLVGMITSRDILWILSKKPRIDLRTVNVMDIATRKIAVIKPSSDIFQALKKMQSLNFRRLPVISRGQLLGIITIKDILSVEPEVYREISGLIDVREKPLKEDSLLDSWPLEGFCESCGNFAELLKVEGQLLCMDCRDELY